jgi:hypothetical protein
MDMEKFETVINEIKQTARKMNVPTECLEDFEMLIQLNNRISNLSKRLDVLCRKALPNSPDFTKEASEQQSPDEFMEVVMNEMIRQFTEMLELKDDDLKNGLQKLKSIGEKSLLVLEIYRRIAKNN